MRSDRVQVNGTIYNVTLEPKNSDKFRVNVNGRIFESKPMTEGEISAYVVMTSFAPTQNPSTGHGGCLGRRRPVFSLSTIRVG